MRTTPLCARDAIVGDYSVLSSLIEQVSKNGSSDGNSVTELRIKCLSSQLLI